MPRHADFKPSPLSKRDWVALGVSVTLAIGLCLYRLGGRSIWHDEAVSLRIAETPGWDVAMSDGGNMALYYLFMRAWVRLGTSLEVLRLPSVLFSAAGVALLYLLARRLFDARIAGMSALLLAVNSSFVYYGQEARSYALVLMLTVGAWMALAVGLERRTVGWFLLWGALNALAVGAHLFSILLVAAQISSLPLLPRRSLPWRALLAGVALTAAGAAPFVLAAAQRRSVQIGWIPRTSIAGLRQVLWFLGGNNFEPAADWLTTYAGVVVLIVCLVGWPTGIWLAVRSFRVHGPSPQAWSYGMAVLWLVVPLVGATVASATVQPLLVPRFFIAAVPASSLLLALAVAQIQPRPVALVTLVLLIALGASGVVRSYGTGNWGWNEAADHLIQAARPGDAVVILPSYQRLSLDYHLRRRPASRSLEVLSPRDAGWRPPGPTVYGVAEAFLLPAPPQRAAREAGLRDRFWVVTSDYTRWDSSGRVEEAWGQASEFFEALDSSFRIGSGDGFGRVGVLLVERTRAETETGNAGTTTGTPAG